MDLHINIKGRRQISAQVYRQIRDAILAGRLRPGDVLPSSRDLALRLQVSRNTVVVTYERLQAEGFLSARPGGATFVNESIRQRTSIDPPASALQPRPIWDEIGDTPDLSRPMEFDFRPGVPDAASFPFIAWRRHWNRQITRRAIGTGAHVDAGGLLELRAAIARHVSLSRAVRATAEDVFVTSGSQQAIDLISRVLLEPGDRVAIEEPGYPLPQRAFRAHGCRLAAVPVDSEGLVVEAIPAGTRLVYVTPSHQWPLGMTLTMRRRQALLEWAERTGAAIIEDDYDSEFRYGGRPLESLHGLDQGGRVLYVGTFSKVLLPTLRLGFAVIPPTLHAAFRTAKQLSDWHTAVPLQATLAQFIDDGQFARHIRRMRRIYAERRERILQILARDFAGVLTPLPSYNGLHLTALLDGHEPPADVSIVARARAQSVGVLPLSRYYVATAPRAGLLLGHGAISTARIDEGLRRLRQLVR